MQTKWSRQYSLPYLSSKTLLLINASVTNHFFRMLKWAENSHVHSTQETDIYPSTGAVFSTHFEILLDVLRWNLLEIHQHFLLCVFYAPLWLQFPSLATFSLWKWLRLVLGISHIVECCAVSAISHMTIKMPPNTAGTTTSLAILMTVNHLRTIKVPTFRLIAFKILR